MIPLVCPHSHPPGLVEGGGWVSLPPRPRPSTCSSGARPCWYPPALAASIGVLPSWLLAPGSAPNSYTSSLRKDSTAIPSTHPSISLWQQHRARHLLRRSTPSQWLAAAADWRPSFLPPLPDHFCPSPQAGPPQGRAALGVGQCGGPEAPGAGQQPPQHPGLPGKGRQRDRRPPRLARAQARIGTRLQQHGHHLQAATRAGSRAAGSGQSGPGVALGSRRLTCSCSRQVAQ